MQVTLWSFGAVALGGAIGAMGRFAIGLAFRSLWPAALVPGTFTVNLVGCFLIGMALPQSWSPTARFLFVTGMLGGFTTFSTWSMETFTLLKTGQTYAAVAYVLGSVLIGLGLTWAGWRLGTYMAG